MELTTHKFDRTYFEEGGYGSSFKNGYYYEQIVPRWDRKIKYIMRQTRPKRALDVGCAKGFFVERFLRDGIEAFGVDISAYALSSASESVRPYLRQVDISLESLPFPDNYFDLIICIATLEHLVNPDHAIKEIARVLAPRGIAFIMTSSPDQPEEKKDETHCNIRSFKQWADSFKRCKMAAKIIPHWKMEGERGRLGRFPIFFRNTIRHLFYPIEHFFLGCKEKPLYIKAYKIS